MAEGKNNSNAVCEKIRDCVSSSPAVRAIRRISQAASRPQTPAMVNSHAKASAIRQPCHVTVIPIEFDPPMNSHLARNGRQSKAAVPKVVVVRIKGTEGKKSKPNVEEQHPKGKKTAGGGDNGGEDRFSDYIKQVKDRIARTMTNFGGGMGPAGGGTPVAAANSPARTDTLNHRASNYINRAQAKIRATSSIGDRKPKATTSLKG